MIKDSGQTIQAMPLLEGKVNLSASTEVYKVAELLHCVEDAEIEITWNTNATATILMLAGQDYAFTGEVVVVSGVLHIS